MAFLTIMDPVDKIEGILSNLDLNKSIVIYPYGRRGKQVKRILNNLYGIKEKYIVDNKSNDAERCIITLDELREMDLTDIIVLLCSDDEKQYNELREQLFQTVPFHQIVDVFSYSMFYDKSLYYSPAHFQDDRISALELAAREIYRNQVDGDIAECGVYKGGFSKYIARFLPDRTLYLFDTFEGFSTQDLVNDKLPPDTLTMFNDTSVDFVLDNIGRQVNTVVRKGYFPDTTNGLEDKQFAFVSLDTDLYNPILFGLEYFWPRLSAGGFIFIHDFGGLRGVNKAVMEFCRRKHISYSRIPDYNTSAILSKPL